MFDYGTSSGRLATALLPRPRLPLPAGLAPPDDGLRMELAGLRTVAPGPELAGRLLDLGVALPDPASQLTLLGLWERYASWVSAQQQAVLAAVAGDEPEPAPDRSSSDDWVREEVGCALRLSPSAAHRRIELARRLHGALRPARDALGRGELTFLHALNLSEQVGELSDAAARAVANRVLPGAGGASLGAFRKAVARAVAAVDPTAMETAQLRARRERRVERWREPNGSAVLAATGPAVDAELIYAALTAAAHATRKASKTAARGPAADGDISPVQDGSEAPAGGRANNGGGTQKPSLDSLRYDALVGWARAALTGTRPDTMRDTAAADTTGEPDRTGEAATCTDEPAPRATGEAATCTTRKPDICAAGEPALRTAGKPDTRTAGEPAASPPGTGPRSRGPSLGINVIIDLPTLLGLAENPTELSGYGPIPPALARDLAADGRWRRFITDPVTGHLLDYGRRSYQPPAALAEYITARDRTCRFPHCTQPAIRCDGDHNQPWDLEGSTSSANLHSLCRRHHRLKTFTRWRYEPQPDGSITWISPNGHTTTDPPPSYGTRTSPNSTNSPSTNSPSSD